MENHPPGRAFLVDTGADGWRLGVHDRRHCRGRIGSEHMFQPYESGQVLAIQDGNVGDTVITLPMSAFRTSLAVDDLVAVGTFVVRCSAAVSSTPGAAPSETALTKPSTC
jgi:hypothetical protein